MPDLLITNATILDGTGAPPRAGDVLIVGDRIAAVRTGDDVLPADAEGVERVDGSGLTLAPGFVDVHTHDDSAVILEPEHACKTLQGVTSVVVGNCGFSPAPGAEATIGPASYDRMSDYLAAVETAGPAVNVAALVGHGSIRERVMGRRTEGPATDEQLTTMLHLLATALDDGAVGFSSGLVYEPGRYSPPAELHAFGEVASGYDAVYATHMRDEGDHLLEAIDECVGVAEANGLRLQISHLKATGADNWGKATQALEKIDAARDRGVDVMADQYPYTRGSTMLEQVVSAGALDGASAFGHLSGDKILVASAPKDPSVEGKTIAELARAAGRGEREVAEEIVRREGRGCFVVLDSMSEEDVCAVMAHPAVMVGTDGIPTGGKPHPRLGHSYPRILGRYVREQGLLDLPDAIRKMTSVPAERFGFTDRGVIREGAFADLVLFDADAVIDTGTWTDPNVAPAGIVGVWVNGERVVDGDSITGARPGRVVRRTGG